jgi:6-methylsalicylate decarboxylase
MVNRGTFLAGLAAAGACAGPLVAAAQSGSPRRIDVHRHVSPPGYAAEIKGAYAKPFPPVLASWTPETCLADMDAAGIELGMLSMPARPGMTFGDVAFSRKFCRESNEYMAELRRQHPGRFGMYAALPLPDVEGSMTELAYALDVLHADGVGVWSSYGQRYLGDPFLTPLWTELNRRNAVVFCHPTDAACCVNPVAPTMSETVVEFAADTTRTIGSLVFSGTSMKFANIKFIFSHGGGLMPYVIDRFHNEERLEKNAGLFPHGVEGELKRFYYDTAFVSSPSGMAALLKLIPPAHVVLGTDYPYAPGKATTGELAVCGAAPADLATIMRASALPLVGAASLRA